MLDQFSEEYQRISEASEQIKEFSKKFDIFIQAYKTLPVETDKNYTFMQFLGKMRHEPTYSKVLAYFLDPNKPHGLGSTVLDSLLTAMQDIDLHKWQKIERVYTEYQLSNRRIDILIESDSGLIVIENKIDNPEDKDQTNDLYSETEEVKEFENKEKTFILLTPGWHKPHNKNFKVLTYKELIGNIEKNTINIFSETPISSAVYLIDFLKTAKEELMQEVKRKKIFSEKGLLYLKYYNEINDVKENFKNELDLLKDNIGNALLSSYELSEKDWGFSARESGSPIIQIWKKNWEPRGLYIHFELWLEDVISEKLLQFMVDIEGNKKEGFFDKLNKKEIGKFYKEKGIQYRPNNRKVALAYKEYSVEGGANTIPEIVFKAFGDFKFLIEYIDNTLIKLKQGGK